DGTSSQILASALSDLNTEPGLPYTVPPGNSVVLEPEGNYVEDGPTASFVSQVDPVNWTQVVNPAQYTLPVPDAPDWVKPTHAPPAKTTFQGGAFRKVVSTTGFTGVSGWAYVPPFDQMTVQAPSVTK